MSGLLKGEILLTADIFLGLIIAEIIIRLRLPEILMKRIIPRNIPAVTAMAVAVSAGSSKAGAAVLSSALSRGEISERCAVWSALMLPLPSYLRRWPATFALSVSMAGLAGGIFAVSLIIRSIMRFMFAMSMAGREGCESSSQREISGKTYGGGVWRNFLRTLPAAWVMFGIAYSVVPYAEGFLRGAFAGGLLPLSGWTVAAASLGHVRGALALAGGSIEAGTLSVSQGVFALVLGSGLGTVTRVLRQDAGYYFGLFPRSTAVKLLLMNIATILPLIMINLLFAGLALLLSS
ncbi:MAG: hypothetical protein IKQ95_00820 [Synergistaceae bacterium]|nr:hypothetical protein [Synergistaceae bacterium]